MARGCFEEVPGAVSRTDIMTWQVFYSYCHEDAKLRKELGTHLAPLRHQRKIDEWHDREIKPGSEWQVEINAKLSSAHLILLLVSADFLASEYCFGVEVEQALARLKRNEVEVIPVLLRPCLWEDSRFSQLQIIPRDVNGDAKAVTTWQSVDEAYKTVAEEIRSIVSGPPPSVLDKSPREQSPRVLPPSLDLVRKQISSYAQLYEKTRQRMIPSDERTRRMEQIFQQMRALAPHPIPCSMSLSAALFPVSAWQRFQFFKSLQPRSHCHFSSSWLARRRPLGAIMRRKHFALQLTA
jgi:TIR domain